MAAFRYDPYLWIHLAGVATVPLWLGICGLGLAVGYPTMPSLELGLIGLLGVLPILFMQLRRPFCIFSLLLFSLKPTALTEDQRRLLTLFHQGWVRLVAVLAPLPLLWVLLQLYPIAVVASDITPFADWGRLGGVAVATIAFLMANLFWQVPVSVLLVMATAEQRFEAIAPYAVQQISQDFTHFGLPLGQILPTVIPPEPVAPPPTSADLAPWVDQSLAPDYAAVEAEVYHHIPPHQAEVIPPTEPRSEDGHAAEMEVAVGPLSESVYEPKEKPD